MGCGHDEAEQHRVTRRPARPHEIGGHDRLAVAGFERMECAEGRRHQRGEEDDAGAGRRGADEVGEAVSARPLPVRLEGEGLIVQRADRAGARGHPASPGHLRRDRRQDPAAEIASFRDGRRTARARCGFEGRGRDMRPDRRAHGRRSFRRKGEPRLQGLGRAGQQIRGVIGELAAPVLPRSRAAREHDARSLLHDHFLPACAVREVPVSIDETIRPRRERVREAGPVDDSQLHRGQLARARAEENAARFLLEHQPTAIHLQGQPFLQDVGLPGQVSVEARMAILGDDGAVLDLLEGRDLRHVDQVAHLDATRIDRDPGVVADGEVPHGVSRRHHRHRPDPQAEQRDERA